MRILVVVVQFLEVVKMVITPPTVCVTRALDVMLNEANRGREVPYRSGSKCGASTSCPGAALTRGLY